MVDQTVVRLETLGPAERIISMLTSYADHCWHGRPGMVTKDTLNPVGVKWEPVSVKDEEGTKVVYRTPFKRPKERVGTLEADNTVKNDRTTVGEYRVPGIFPEVVTWMYRQIADIWKMDNDFAAHLASWSYGRDHRDLKVILAAFMLCQSRFGEPVKDPNGKVEFFDDDFRAVGEAMCLIYGQKDCFTAKHLIRIGEVLKVPGVAKINHDLGFGKSAREPHFGRFMVAVRKWLDYRDQNPKALEALVKSGWRNSIMKLSRWSGYKPTGLAFFDLLRWKQVQAKDGRRTISIGKKVKKAESWVGLTERQICNRIMKDKPGYKRLVGMLPSDPGMTQAIMAAAIESGSLSDADLIILAPTLEELGLLNDPDVSKRWKSAVEKAENQRAANIARNVKKAETADVLKAGADANVAKVMEEATRNMRVYVMVDISGSMEVAIELAKSCLTKFLGGFPVERVRISVFNTMGREVTLKAPTAAGVEHAFRPFCAGGGTCYQEGVAVLAKYKPGPDEDAVFIFVGDEGQDDYAALVREIRRSGLNPVAFGLLKVKSSMGQDGTIVQDTARELGIPCFMINPEMFNDPYSVNRTLTNLIKSTPVGTRVDRTPAYQRKTLIQEILDTKLLAKPHWAA